MTPEETIQRVRQAMAALNQGDVEGAAKVVHPDFSYTIRGRGSVSGVYQDWDAMAGVLRRILDLTDGTLTATPEVVLADNENVLMYMKVTASRPDGRTYDSHQAYRYRLKDGLVLEGETIPVDQHAFAEFMTGEAETRSMDLTPQQVVERFYELYDDGTPDSYGSDRFTDLWADDIVMDYGASAAFPRGRRLEGKARMLKELERVGSWMRNRHAVLRDLTVEGETAAAGWSFWATTVVEMPGIPAGSRVRMDGADFMTIRDGLIVCHKQLSGPMVVSTDEDEV